MKKICPKCKRKYTELENYCTKCGIELEKEPNRCSANNTFENLVIYCSISLTYF